MKKDLQVEKLQRLPLEGCRLSRPAMALTWRFMALREKGNPYRRAVNEDVRAARIRHEVRDESSGSEVLIIRDNPHVESL